MENIQTKQKKKKGFTLIELIIVIAILGILALIAIPKFGSAQKDAKVKADIATAKTIAGTVSTALAKGDATSRELKKNFQNFANIDSNKVITDGLNGKTKVQALENGNFQVMINENEDVIVQVAGKSKDGSENITCQLYPYRENSQYPNATDTDPTPDTN
ncbi:type II secretion system protein [Clostridium botulinum]|uniref:type II secretion system protein n=1 Tax=Clostridium botulinum TaxID=1491 RepID=UPI0004D93BED|nr:prepilin-type N-terminal cleavage/methylation domain-containing protein [Clostridium botulinum]KEH92241.1 protein-PII uridylyltransferase [Clostridium botulinum C/D str. It1]